MLDVGSTVATTSAESAQANIFSQYRPLLFSIAYRMLGSVMDAEDAVQETYLRWQQAPRGDIQSPKSYLSTVVTRLCIDQLRSARTKREQYIGPWLPEPLVGGGHAAVDDTEALADSLSVAFLVLLESLSPIERAVFLLREVFDYDYEQIAEIVGKSEANCRQLLHRARSKVSKRPHRFEVEPQQVARMMERFLRAANEGDPAALIEFLSDDVTLWSDGGGKVAAARNPIYGADKVSRFFIGIMQKLPADISARAARVNGGPGVIMYGHRNPYCVITADFAGDKLSAIRIIVNPDKLLRVPRLN